MTKRLGKLIRYSVVIDDTNIADAAMLQEDIQDVLGLSDIKVSKGYYPKEYVIYTIVWESFKTLVEWLQEGKYIE
jgi:hypothetical protein